MIEIKNIVKKFGQVTALNDFSCKIEDGVIFGLVGSNGSGKSTLLRIMSGVFQADLGEVLIDGNSSLSNFVKNQISFISDYPYFFNDSTVNNLSKLYSQMYSNWNEERFISLCQTFPINPNAKIINMSKGMQRQASLILNLSTMPKYLFLDEIFDGLDPVVRQLVKKLVIDDVIANKITVVIASHNLRELEDICDHIGLLHKGGIVLDRNLDDLKLGIHRVQIAINNPNNADPFKALNIIKKEQHGSLYNIVIKGNKDEFMPILEALNPVFIESLPLTLEEVFISEMEGAGYDINNII